jgi:hypothetical protein
MVPSQLPPMYPSPSTNTYLLVQARDRLRGLWGVCQGPEWTGKGQVYFRLSCLSRYWESTLGCGWLSHRQLLATASWGDPKHFHSR